MYPNDLNGRPIDSETAGDFADRVADRLASLSFVGATSDVAPGEASWTDPVAPEPTADEAPVPVMSAAPPSSPFLDELARAMLAAADRERERILAELVDEAAGQVEKVQARAAAETAEIERQAGDAQDRIHEWAQLEIERIRQEEARRLDDRRDQLNDHLAQHAALIGAETTRVESAVEAYRAQLDEFLGRLAQEPSPVEIARLAGTLPDSPDFDEVRASARAEAVAGLVDQGAGASFDPDAASTALHPEPDESSRPDPIGVMGFSASEVAS